ncbi:MAG: hypothetical protein DI539_19885, partial [Flavobacterium psychrophilum]
SDKQVVGNTEVDEIMAIMGQPEDYRIDEETTGEKNTSAAPDFSYYPRTKKFYRDGEKSIISGVCAGLSHYFRIDPLWIRILFIISLFISFGSSVFIYILLWILIPKAITTTEKLEMTGEPINISNIEKKVKEEIDSVAGKFQNVDYDKLGRNAKTGAEKIGSGIGSVFSALFKGFAKAIGAIIAVTAAIMLGIGVVFYFSLLFTSSFKNSMWHPWVDGFNYTDAPIWLMGTAIFFMIAIPLFVIFLLGLKILVDNLRPVGNITKLTLLALWIISFITVLYIGITETKEINDEGKTVFKKDINLFENEAAPENDTLYIKFRYNDYFAKSVYPGHNDFRFTQDSIGNDVIYSNDVSLVVMKTDEKKPFIQIEKISNGRTSAEARKRAEKINYNFKFEGKTLTLDNYLITDITNKYRNQKVEIYLYLPEGTLFKCDDSVKEYDNTEDWFFNLWWDNASQWLYQMKEDKVECLNCPVDDVAEEDMPAPPAPPAHVHINGAGKGRIDISDEDVNLHVSVDSLSVTSKRKK